MKVRRRIEIEDVGLDLSKLRIDDLLKIAEVAESEIRRALDEVLGPRMIKYLLTVDVYIDDKLNLFVDLIVDSLIPPYISLESVIERALKRGVDKAAAFVRELARKMRETTSGTEGGA